MKWHQSLIVRGALVAVAIYLIGFGASTYSVVSGLRSFAEIAQNPEFERSLANNLTHIKEIHSLRQTILVERLQALAVQSGKNPASASASEVQQWVAEAIDDKLFGEDFRAETLAAFATTTDTATIAWLDKDRLRVGPWLVTFTRGELFERFKSAESTHQAYQLIGATLHSQIIPRTLKFHGVSLGTVLLLALIGFAMMSQRLQRQLSSLLAGFTTWSERDVSFRFSTSEKGKKWSGELQQIASQFDVMADEVESNKRRSLYLEKIASWQVIARKLAHEVKNPLTPIQMMVSQLKRRYTGTDPEYLKLLDDAHNIIGEEIAGLRRMVDSFSSFARLPQPNLQPTDLDETCRQVVELQKVAFPNHAIVFEGSIKKGSTSTLVNVDDQLVRQVLLNLIKNAAEASEGVTAPTIKISCEILSKVATIRVEDNGPGIPLDMQSKIFEAYVTTKHTGPTPGMGLGLAICQKIMLDHNGDLTVASRPGQTTFTMKFNRTPGP